MSSIILKELQKTVLNFNSLILQPTRGCPGTVYCSGSWNQKLRICSVSKQSARSVTLLHKETNSKDKFSSWMNEKIESYFKSEIRSTLKKREITGFLAEVLSVDRNFVATAMQKHPKRRFIQLKDVVRTIKYLQEMGFERDIIIESLAVCFYPVENIEYGFRQISENEAELRKMGLINGFVLEETKAFRAGTLGTDKRLQLCLYYMELPFCFSGSGIFHLGHT